ncbi:MAG TPA: TonB-dependent receptor, partial [Chitinophagaceae bacterium]|nr:TonB-dependent receptor [Chitinophagaceae bacterium]
MNIPALLFNYKFSPRTTVQLTSHYLFGQRNSVQFLNAPAILDTVNTSIGSYNPRQVDRDYYNGFTTEARALHTYTLRKRSHVVSAGIRYFNQTTKRRQKGLGTTGSDFDLTLTKPYGIDLKLHTINYAVFAENIFNILPKLSVTPGVRYEVINTKTKGL